MKSISKRRIAYSVWVAIGLIAAGAAIYQLGLTEGLVALFIGVVSALTAFLIVVLLFFWSR